MRIRSISYRRLITGEGFSNRAVEAAADVGEGEDPAACLKELEEWVEAQLAAHRSIDDLRRTRDDLHWEVQALKKENTALALQNKTLRDANKRGGGQMTEDDRMPF